MTDLTECYPCDKELKKFIGMTFESITKFVPGGNLSVLEHSVNFFADVSRKDKLQPELLAYPR